jgi:hypothetical protein
MTPSMCSEVPWIVHMSFELLHEEVRLDDGTDAQRVYIGAGKAAREAGGYTFHAYLGRGIDIHWLRGRVLCQGEVWVRHIAIREGHTIGGDTGRKDDFLMPSLQAASMTL